MLLILAFQIIIIISYYHSSCGFPSWGTNPQWQTPQKASTNSWLWTRDPSHQAKTQQLMLQTGGVHGQHLCSHNHQRAQPHCSEGFPASQEKEVLRRSWAEWCSCLDSTGKHVRVLSNFHSWGTQSGTMIRGQNWRLNHKTKILYWVENGPLFGGGEGEPNRLCLIWPRADTSKRGGMGGVTGRRGEWFFWSIKNLHEEGEIRFARATISIVVTVIEKHNNDSLGKCVSQKGEQKWCNFREATQKQVARLRHCLQAWTQRQESKITSTGLSDRQEHNIVHVAWEI